MESPLTGVNFTLIKPTELYNLLQQGLNYPNLSDPNFLLMLDARSKIAYNESHIVTAKKAPQIQEHWVMLPYDSEVECRSHIVVYDGNTSLENKVEGPAVSCADFLWRIGSRNPVKILEGGYEAFSALYPFLRTQKTIFMPRELDDIQTYPAEILPGSLYLGNYHHGNAPNIQKDLKIKAYIACCMNPMEPGHDVSDERPILLHVPIEDTNIADISAYFEKAVSFISRNIGMGQPVLVYSDLGISRSAAIIIAYLISVQANSLQVAYKHVASCRWCVRPNRGFITQLSDWEEKAFGAVVTIISDPHF